MRLQDDTATGRNWFAQFGRLLLASASWHILASHVVAADQSVTISLRGEIAAECQILDPPQNLELGEIQPTGSHQLTFAVNCNAPFRYQLTSAEGGLRNLDEAQEGSVFVSLIPYQVEIFIPTDTGEIADVCQSSQLTSPSGACNFSDSGDGIAMSQTGRMTLSWSVSKPLLAGDYNDLLMLTITPRL